MKKIKAINGYTIYQATSARDLENYGCEINNYNIYFSSDIRDYGLTMSTAEFENIELLAICEGLCDNNYAKARELAENESTAVSFERIEEIEQQLDAGKTPDDIEEEQETTDEPEEERRTAEEITADIIALFEEDEELFNNCLLALDSYNGYLGDDRYYEMELIDEFYHDGDPLELLRRAFYGYDLDNVTTTASGNRENAPFNPKRDYFRYNGYGNFVSTNYPDYSDKRDRYAIEEMLENRVYIDAIDRNEKLAQLFDELDALDEND